MLDKRTTQMLEVANQLTEEDLDYLRSTCCATVDPSEEPVTAEDTDEDAAKVTDESDRAAPQATGEPQDGSDASGAPASPRIDPSRGERERKRTRDSKIATECVGHERAKHDWWPVGTQLRGNVMGEVFTALVVENSQVKSGRSLLITSGPANGKVCITPTRAALEATETYRQANNLGRGGGVTNGWEFWSPVTS